MVFNWFRRQRNTSGSTPEQPPSEPSSDQTTEPQSLEPDSNPSLSSESKDPSQDYLKWAKAAYQNIQKQQETPAEEVETEATVTAPAEPVEQLEETPPSPSVAEEKATSPVTPAEVTQLTAESPEEKSEPEPPETAEAEEAEPTETEPLPFWAKAEAERQARIERLKETAVTEPEPATATETSATSTGVTFDEMFMWSAEVLANQGRRPDEVALEEITWLQKLWKGLGRTRRNLLNQLKAIVGQGPLNQAAVEEIESLLLQADVGIDATDTIVEALQEKIRQEVLPPEKAIAYLKQILRDLLEKPYQNGYNPVFAPQKDTLNIWLITGVNGAGKTTTIGKIAHLATKSDYQCLIGAADTFRAAAVEQVKIWGERSGVEVIANPGKNTDPAAVVFDAIAAAQARNTELLLIDTAGRLQNKKNLMEELNKIRRVVDKKVPDAIVESLLVLDATLGQNGLRQAEVFAEAAQLSGVVLTKLDGTAKGGVALAVVQQLGLPIRFIGVGESLEDLRPFSSYEFIEALLSG